MAFTTENVRTGDGTTTDFSFTFPYINESDVEVTITDADGIPQSNTAFTFANATTLSFTTAPANNRTIRIFRNTNLDNAEVTYFAGSAIRAEDLNDNQNQVLYSAQEVENNAILLTGGTMTGPLVLDDTTLQIQEGSDTLTIDAPALSENRTVSFTDVSGNVVTTGDTGTVTRAMLADSAINAGKLADDSVDSQHYVAGSIDLEHMSANSVDSDQYVDGSIDRVHLANDVINGDKIADDVVDSEHIAAGAIDLEHMSANSVDSDQYVDGSIDLVHMSANSVDSDQYVDGSIDGVHIANDAIDSQHYAAGSIDNEHLANNSVDSNQLVNGSVDLVHMSANSVDSDQYVDGSIDLIHMSANSVDSDQYVDGSIDEVHLADGAVTSTKIANDTIVNADIKSDAAIAGTKINMSLNELSDVNVGTPGENQDDQVLTWQWDTNTSSGSFGLAAGGSGGSGLSDVVSDNTPQLGGDLDVNGNKIVTDSDNDNVIIDPHGTGALQLSTSSKGSITTSGNNDLELNPAGTGKIIVAGEVTTNSNNNIILNPNGTGDVELGADLDLKGNEIVSTDNATIGIQASGNGDVIINDAGTSTCNFQVQSNANSPSIFSNGSNGRVGIGTDSPGNTLHVAGATQVDGNVIVTNGNNLQLNPTNNPQSLNLRINADDLTTAYNLTMPPAPGSASQVLRINTIDNSNNTELEWGTIDVSTAPRLEHSNTTDGFTVAADSNAAMVGPLTVNDGESILIGPGGNGSNANSVFKIL